MGREEYCPSCELSVSGLYQRTQIGLTKNNTRKWKYERRAYYCKTCERVLMDDEIVYKKIIFEKKK